MYVNVTCYNLLKYPARTSTGFFFTMATRLPTVPPCIHAWYSPREIFMRRHLVHAPTLPPLPHLQHIKAIERIGFLHHPNLVKHLTWYVEDRTLHMIRASHASGDLSTTIKHFKKARKVIPERSIWKYVTQVCAALSYMHDHKIAHRDVRPGTVRFTRGTENPSLPIRFRRIPTTLKDVAGG